MWSDDEFNRVAELPCEVEESQRTDADREGGTSNRDRVEIDNMVVFEEYDVHSMFLAMDFNSRVPLSSDAFGFDYSLTDWFYYNKSVRKSTFDVYEYSRLPDAGILERKKKFFE